MTFQDLLGGEPDLPERRGPGRPKGGKNALKPGEMPVIQTVSRPQRDVNGGVTVPWLATMTGKSRKSITDALKNLEPLGTGRNGGFVYDFMEAMSYLVTPRRDLRDFMKTLTAKDLPQELRETFWNAKIKEAKFRTIAGELWPTGSILDVLGETFKTIKTTTQLWTDTIDESTGLTNEQRALLIGLVDRLMAELHQSLISNARSSMTTSFLEEFENEET